jgi:hypothetical protein
MARAVLLKSLPDGSGQRPTLLRRQGLDQRCGGGCAEIDQLMASATMFGNG